MESVNSMSNAIIALSLKNEIITLKELLSITNRFLFKYISLKILLFAIVFVPVLILGGIAILLFYLNKIIGAISIIFFPLMTIVYIIIIGLRLFFANQVMFMESAGAVTSLKYSYNLTKGHIRQVLIIFAIVYGLTLFINSSVSKPLFATFSEFIFSTNQLKMAINLVILVFFIILEAFVLSFENLFVFYSYIDFKGLRRLTK